MIIIANVLFDFEDKKFAWAEITIRLPTFGL